MKSAISEIFLAIFVLILVIAPLTRMFYRFSITYNEGWTVYHSEKIAEGKQIYDTKNQFTPVVYPPLFFYLEGLLGKFIGDFLMIGRVLSLLGLLCTAILAGLIVRIYAANAIGSVFAAIFFCGAVAAIAPQYVAMNDPQLPAHVLSAAGLWAYLRAVRKSSSLWIAAFLVIAAVFTKHNLIAIPAAITIDLLLRSRREFFRWCLFASAFIGIFAAFTFLFAGQGFFDQVFAGRYMSVEKMIAHTRQFATFTIVPLIASILWCVRSWKIPAQRVLILWLFFSLLIGSITAAGFGTAMNMFFDAFLSMAVILSILILNLQPLPQALLPLLLSVAIIFSAISDLQTLLKRNLKSRLAKQEAGYISDVHFLKTQSGRVVCGNPLLCFDAGKPLEFDPFNVSQRIITGRMKEDDAVRLFQTGAFRVVQIKEQHYEKDSKPTIEPQIFADTFFTQNMIVAIRENYIVQRKSFTGNFYFYQPSGHSFGNITEAAVSGTVP